MATIDDYVPITKAKTTLLDIVRSLHGKNATIAITKNGVPEAVLLSMETYEGLMETIDILSDPDIAAGLKASAEDDKNGRLISEDAAFHAL